MSRWTAKDVLRATGKRGNKYNAKKKVVDGIEFDSTKEARRYQDLVLMQKAGQISDLRRQVPFALTVNGQFLCNYNADFVYREVIMRQLDHVNLYAEIVEDVKGHKTDVYKLKKMLMKACYGIEIKET